MKEFWVSSGHHLLDRGAAGELHVSDDFLKAYFARPELAPPQEACPVERGLHADLLANPRRVVEPAEIAAMVDVDARENWQIMLDFRDHLLRHASIEAAYLALIRGGVGRVPPLFLNQLTHLILRNALDDELDAFRLRAAELFFRDQRLSTHEDNLLLADAEVIEGFEEQRDHMPLMKMLGGPAVSEMEILTPANAELYHRRSDGHDFVLDFRPGARGRAALGEVIAIWVKHLLGLSIRVVPLERIEDSDWRWFLGLDQDGTRIGNRLWREGSMADEDKDRVLALYRIEFDEPDLLIETMRGKPAYAIVGVGEGRIVRLKPQNLITGLPVREGVA